MQKIIQSEYGHKLRVRVCGLIMEGNKLLMVKHIGIGKSGFFYAPPGGGVNYGESLEQALIKEYKEETHLDIEPGRLVLVHEFLEPPLHAVEFFFLVERYSGKLMTGTDPEHAAHEQIIERVEWVDFDALKTLEGSVHKAILSYNTLYELIQSPLRFIQHEK